MRCAANAGCTSGRTTDEIERCKIWLDDERRLVKPEAIIALGVTAARSLTGKTVTIAKLRGKPLDLADGTRLFVTVHPSSLLRIEDEDDKRAAYQQFVADLKSAAEFAPIRKRLTTPCPAATWALRRRIA